MISITTKSPYALRALVELYRSRASLTGDLGGSATTDEFTDALCKRVA